MSRSEEVMLRRYYAGTCVYCGQEPLRSDRFPKTVLGEACGGKKIPGSLASNIRLSLGLGDDD